MEVHIIIAGYTSDGRKAVCQGHSTMFESQKALGYMLQFSKITNVIHQSIRPMM